MSFYYTYKLSASENTVYWGEGNASCRLEITNTATGETKVCDDFTYLDDDTQWTLSTCLTLTLAKKKVKKTVDKLKRDAILIV